MKITLIRFFQLVGNLAIPAYTFVMFLLHSRTITGLVFFIIISACIVERAWETFKTSLERKREELHGDWTLAAVTAAYLVGYFLSITEFYLLRHASLHLSWTVAGVVLLAGSFRLRFWGMAALGKQWAIHAVGAQKIRRVRLIKIGPYRYIRHPVYLGIMTEFLAYPLIANAVGALLFAVFVGIPLVVTRALYEEKTSLRRFGDRYIAYRREVGMFLPKHSLAR